MKIRSCDPINWVKMAEVSVDDPLPKGGGGGFFHKMLVKIKEERKRGFNGVIDDGKNLNTIRSRYLVPKSSISTVLVLHWDEIITLIIES